jgi:hypothetical protein
LDTQRRILLPGGPDHSASWVEIAGDGRMAIEFYDHSDEAQTAFGNDVAYLLTIAAGDSDTVLYRLLDDHPTIPAATDMNSLLLSLIARKFTSYFDLKEWLEAESIPFARTFSSWA